MSQRPERSGAPPDCDHAEHSPFVPFSRPTLGAEEESEVLEVLRSGWLTTGPRVQRFEALFRERLGMPHAIAVSSCTAGMHLALASLDLAPADEVIVPSITWAATANVVELCGARTVLADVDPRTLCLDLDDVEQRITPRTRAVLPVHFAGQPVDLDRLRALATEHGLVVVEDAAHALGARYREREVGAGSECAVFSFHPNKNATTGEGGMVVCSDDRRAERIRLLRFHGVTRDTWKRYQRGGTPQYEVLEPGWKYNMTDLEAALGLHQVPRVDGFNARRRERAERYDRLLAELPEVEPLERVAWPSGHAWHLYVVRLAVESLDCTRDEVIAALQEEKVGAGLHYPALHVQPYYQKKYGYAPGSLPGAEEAHERILSLPLFPTLEAEDQERVAEALGRVLRAHRREA